MPEIFSSRENFIENKVKPAMALTLHQRSSKALHKDNYIISGVPV